jgi:hypothetical protein
MERNYTKGRGKRKKRSTVTRKGIRMREISPFFHRSFFHFFPLFPGASNLNSGFDVTSASLQKAGLM